MRTTRSWGRWTNAEGYDRGEIERMVGHYQQLLEGIAADPAQPIGGTRC
ncbi:MAG: hypothetical protein SFX73_28910 [Kofleriaceae bacterium]|nr:hypothetical protein [Kofleriaceae bacterium]